MTTSITLKYQRDASIGDLESLKQLEKTYTPIEGLHPNGDDDFAFRAAASNGHINVVGHLLCNTSADIHTMDDFALIRVCERGFVDLATMFLTGHVFTFASIIRATYGAIHKKQVAIIEAIIHLAKRSLCDYAIPLIEEMAIYKLLDPMDTLFKACSKDKQRVIIKHMLELGVKRHCADIVEHFILLMDREHPGYKPTLDHYLISDSLLQFEEDVVYDLFQRCTLPRSELKSSQLLSIMVLHGFTDIVEELLQRDDVDISYANYECIMMAAEGDSENDLEVILCSHTDQIPAKPRAEACMRAAQKGHVDVVDLLLYYDNGSMVRALNGFELISNAITNRELVIANLIAREDELQLSHGELCELALQASKQNLELLLGHLLRKRRMDDIDVCKIFLQVTCFNSHCTNRGDRISNSICDMLMRYPGVCKIMVGTCDELSHDVHVMKDAFYIDEKHSNEVRWSIIRIIIGISARRLRIKQLMFEQEYHSKDDLAYLMELKRCGILFEHAFNDDIEISRTDGWIRGGCQNTIESINHNKRKGLDDLVVSLSKKCRLV